MKKKSVIAIFTMLCAIFFSSMFAVNAQQRQSDELPNHAESVVLGVGIDETERNIAYFSRFVHCLRGATVAKTKKIC